MSRNRITAKLRQSPEYDALTRHLDSLGIRWSAHAHQAKGHPYLAIHTPEGDPLRYTIACTPRGWCNTSARVARLNRFLRQNGLI